MSKEGISTYILCSCVSKLPQGGTGCFGVFRPKASTTPRIPKVDSTLCAVIISKSNGQMLDSDELRSLGDAEGLFIFPSPLASGNMSNVQKFYGVAQSDYGNVVDRIFFNLRLKFNVLCNMYPCRTLVLFSTID